MDKVLDYVKIGKRIRIERLKNDFTQQELAYLVDLSVSHLSNIETGKTIVSLEAMYQIADALHVSVDYLLKDYREDDEILVSSIIQDCDDIERKIIIDTIETLKKSLRESKDI